MCNDDLLNQMKNFCKNLAKVRGATVSGMIQPMPNDHNDHAVPFDDPPIWEGNNYFDPAHPTRVTVPNRRGGRYFIHAELQWNSMPQIPFTAQQSQAGCFVGAFLVRNGMTATSIREAQSVAPVVIGSNLISHNLMLETHLRKNHFIELVVFQRVLGGGMPSAAMEIEVRAELTVRRLGRSA